tara:strand:+ start:131 stop:343 length:213 start_codon:yes stop_codon:yes gene_type:complete
MNIGYPDTKNKKGSGGPLLKSLTKREQEEKEKEEEMRSGQMAPDRRPTRINYPKMNYNLDLRKKPTIRQT